MRSHAGRAKFYLNCDHSNFSKIRGSFALNLYKIRPLPRTALSSLPATVPSNAADKSRGEQGSHALSVAVGILAGRRVGLAAERRLTICEGGDQRRRCVLGRTRHDGGCAEILRAPAGRMRVWIAGGGRAW